jgi:hypothetical protein
VAGKVKDHRVDTFLSITRVDVSRDLGFRRRLHLKLRGRKEDWNAASPGSTAPPVSYKPK